MGVTGVQTCALPILYNTFVPPRSVSNKEWFAGVVSIFYPDKTAFTD